MSFNYNYIYNIAIKTIKKHNTTDPKSILEDRNVHIMPFVSPTRLLGMFTIIKRNKFVFYNPNADENTLKMVFAHELGHDILHSNMKDIRFAEYTLFDINSEMELEANIFASHLLLNEDEILNYAKLGYNYNQIASTLGVNINLLIFKLNEMQRQGCNINSSGLIADYKFLKK